VLRVPVGGYIHGGLCHSQNIEATFSHFPGLKVALPCTALDAYGLLKTAIRGDDPVLFLEHKSLYRQNFAKSRLPDDVNFMMPFGRGRVTKEGRDVSIITYGALVYRSLEAARILEGEGIQVEVIDLISIRPLDFELIRKSIAKTSRALVLYEDNKFMGFGAEIAAQIAESCFEMLDAPIMRVAGADVPIPYAADLESAVLPQVSNIVDGVRLLVGY
jgi:2-oxoisovalerate dehydrogenase E1 component